MAARTPKIPARASKAPANTLLNSSLDGMDDLFDFQTKEQPSQQGQEAAGAGLAEMDFDRMEPFPDHKFKLYTGQRLEDMVDSIREFGILEPLILWKHGDRHTILSGHNRVNAAKLAGLTQGPVVIREDLTYEDAVLIVTETNLRQRSFDDLSPSEKALCLKQHYDAIKSQGRRNDLLKEIEGLVNPQETGQNGTSLGNPKKSDAGAAVSGEYGLSRDRIARYLKIATLITPLLDCLDAKLLGFEAAYDISFVKAEQQLLIAELIAGDNFRIDTKKSALLHDYARKGKLTEERIRQIVTEEKTRKPKNSSQPIKIKETVINRFFDDQQSRKEIEETIIKALELYFAQGGEKTGRQVG
ncbi:MAG TPA: chromosome partitioning protein ParB [Lachnospiraceae bacterium]|nr:chromosome partitioning protein ParB [Lachnospiraceae bacterium]HCT90698.1 chromosome partitioning protein ParB [Lachnospiraceae bacterium]